LYKIAQRHAKVPVKVSVGAGPANLAWHVYFKHYKNAKELSLALAPIFNAEMKDLVAAGAKYLQFEDLGPWLPLFTNDKNDYVWIKDVVAQCCDGVKAKIGWHFCFGNAWGNDILSASYPEGYQTVLPHFFDTPGIDEFVLDYANRDMAGIDFMKNLPKDKSLQVGVVDIRTNAIESPEKIVARIKKVTAVVPPERLCLSTDCGMKPLARMVAKMKLNSLAEAAKIVRKEIKG
jgi:5-methyltetrahydropteroyltriglutamate--homocysteine methyltransferase